jgi:hypothetical protein
VFGLTLESRRPAVSKTFVFDTMSRKGFRQPERAVGAKRGLSVDLVGFDRYCCGFSS